MAENLSAPPVSAVSPESAMPSAEVAATIESASTPLPPTEPATAPAQPSAPVPPPTAVKEDANGYEAMAAQIAELRAQLQASNIKSALAERRLTPHDSGLVVRLIEEKVSNGETADKACAELYKTHPYLFKAPQVVQKSGPSDEELAQTKSLNDAYVKGVISRLRRDAISFGGTSNG